MAGTRSSGSAETVLNKQKYSFFCIFDLLLLRACERGFSFFVCRQNETQTFLFDFGSEKEQQQTVDRLINTRYYRCIFKPGVHLYRRR